MTEQITVTTPDGDAKQVKEVLRGREAEIISNYRGDPNQRLSTRRDVRWGTQGSLSLDVQRGLWYDHELGQGGDILEFIKKENGFGFPEALGLASDLAGFTSCNIPARREAPQPAPEPEDDPDELERMESALEIWDSVGPLRSSVAEAYLISRGIAVPDDGFHDLGFAPRCPWRNGTTPAMVGLLSDIITGEPCAIHRTALTPDGRKIGRKLLGPKSGCAIKLVPDSEVGDELAIAEGIETALSGQAFGFAPTWSVVDAGGIRTFPVLRHIRRLTIFVDNDVSSTGEKVARVCKERWEAAGKVVRLIIPTKVGMDFNDVLIDCSGWPQ